MEWAMSPCPLYTVSSAFNIKEDVLLIQQHPHYWQVCLQIPLRVGEVLQPPPIEGGEVKCLTLSTQYPTVAGEAREMGDIGETHIGKVVPYPLRPGVLISNAAAIVASSSAGHPISYAPAKHIEGESASSPVPILESKGVLQSCCPKHHKSLNSSDAKCFDQGWQVLPTPLQMSSFSSSLLFFYHQPSFPWDLQQPGKQAFLQKMSCWGNHLHPLRNSSSWFLDLSRRSSSQSMQPLLARKGKTQWHQTAIQKHAPRLRIRLPSPWKLLELEAHKLGQRVVKRSKCSETAKVLGFETKEGLTAVLPYLHKANFLFYDSEVLP